MIERTEIGETLVEILPQYKNIFTNTAVRVHNTGRKFICSFSQGRSHWTDSWIQHIFESNPVPFCIVNNEGKILFANSAFCKWLGYTKDSLRSSNFWDICNDNEHEIKVFNFKSSISTSKQALLFHSFSWDENNVSGLIWSPIDHHNVFTNHTVWNFFPVPIMIFNDKGILIECNAAFKISHPSCIDWNNQTFQCVFKNVFQTTIIFKKLLANPLETQFAVGVISTYNPHIKGKWHFLHIPDGGQSIILCCFQSGNMSPESDKLQSLGRLASFIAHDSNNILTVMIGLCDSLLYKQNKSTDVYHGINEIRMNTIRLINLYRYMKSFSKNDIVKIDIAKSMEERREFLQKLVGETKLSISIEKRCLYCLCQPDFLDQVLLNLVSNAKESMTGENNSIEISTGLEYIRERKMKVGEIKTGSYIYISVRDHGSGIPSNIQDKIFEPFFSSKSSIGGTGIGLSAVANVVLRYNGAINFQTKLGSGTTFTVYIPYTEQSIEKNESYRDLSIKNNDRKKILLVEDIDGIRFPVTKELERNNYEVVGYRDAVNAEEKLKTFNADLLITDIALPAGKNGISLARNALSRDNSIKILFISGYSSENIIESFDNKAFFLEKPFTTAQVIEKVNEILKEKS